MSRCYIDMYIACIVNTIKHQINLKYIQKLSSYLKVNTTRLQCKDQPATWQLIVVHCKAHTKHVNTQANYCILRG
jgi:hypothetical protein